MVSLLRKFCQIFLVLIFCAFITTLHPDSAFAGKAGINIGDHFGEVDQAAAIVGDGGWIVVMAQPGDCMALSEMIKKYDKINFVIRGHHPSTAVMSPDHAKAWAYTLANMDTGGNKVYFYPINEPFTWGAREGFSDDDQTTAVMVNDYVTTLLNEYPDIKKKVNFLSPMINRSDPGFATHIQLLKNVNPNFFSVGPEPSNNFVGISMNLYDFQTCNSPFCHPNPNLNAGSFNDTLSAMGLPDSTPVYGVESGVVPPPGTQVVYEDNQLRNFFSIGHDGEGPFTRPNLAMTAVFSYDPHTTGWNIYNPATYRTADYIAGLPSLPDPPASEWTEADTAAFKSFIQPKLDSGEVVQCDECGLSPVTPSGEKFCQGTGKYTLDIFPEYDTNPNEFLLYPICPYDESDPRAAYCGGSPSKQGLERVTHGIKMNLLEQGYTVQCAENELKIQGGYSGNWTSYLSVFNSRRGDLSPQLQIPGLDSTISKSSQVIDYTNVKFPVFRDISGKRWRMTSIEEFFGFKDIYSNNDSVALLNSSPVEKLLSKEQRCLAAVEVLTDAKTLCDRENLGANCALNTVIPDPSNALNGMKRFDVLEMYESSGLSCQEIVNQPKSTLALAISQTPLYLEKLYRLAFLVSSIELKPADSAQFFNFMSLPNYGRTAALKHEARVIAFKIPDVSLASLSLKSSNFKLNKEDDEPENIEYKDPIRLTRDSVLSTKQQESVEEERIKERELFGFNSYTTWWSDNPNFQEPANVPEAHGFINNESLEDQIGDKTIDEAVQDGDIKGGYRMMSGAETINCTLTKGCGGESGDPDPMMRALIDFVNTKTDKVKNYNGVPTQANPLNCRPSHVKITQEKVEIIGDPVNLTGRENEPQVDDLAQTNIKILEELLNEAKGDTPLEKAGFNDFTTEFQPVGDNAVIATINTYLVYPGDYDAEVNANAIRSPFVPFEMATRVDENRRDNCDPYVTNCEEDAVKVDLRFSVIGGLMNFVADSISRTAYDITDPPGCIIPGETTPPGSTAPRCKKFEFSLFTLSPDVHKLVGIPGEKLGFWMKDIQKFLSPENSIHYEYLASCRTTEEFLLGACGGGGLGTNNPTNPFPNAPGGGSCQPAPPDDPYCSIEALMARFPSFGAETAREASIICMRESGANPNALNNSCLTGGTVDYSVGLFQFNMLAHCPGCLYDANGRTNQDEGYDAWALPCSVANQALLNQYESAYKNPEYNLQKMYDLSNGGRNWQPWSAARACGIQ